MSETVRTHYPQSFDEFVGQTEAVRQLKIRCAAAKSRGVPLDHVLIASPLPGVGKSSLARLTAMTMDVKIVPQNEQIPVRLLPFLMQELRDGQILFLDEAHKQFDGGKRKAEWLLTFLETGKIPTDFGLEDAPAITVVAATTDVGRFEGPFLTRFPIQLPIVPYTDEEGALIVAQLARKVLIVDGLTEPTPEVCAAVTRAAGNNPREALNVLKALRDLVQAGEVTENGGEYELAEAISFAGLTPDGLTSREVAYLRLLGAARGRPLGRRTLAEQLGEVAGGMAYIEGRLVTKGLISLADNGRLLTPTGRERTRELAAAA